MGFELDRVGTFLAPDPSNPWERGGTFNPGLYRRPGSAVVDFTYRAVPVSGANPGEFRPGVYLSSVGGGRLRYDPRTGGLSVRRDPSPWLTPVPTSPHHPLVSGMGYEDASRLSRLPTPDGGRYVLPFTAVGMGAEGGVTVRIGLATSASLGPGGWTVHGLVGPPDVPAKAATVFPTGDGGRCGMLFTIWPDSRDSAICYAEFDDLAELVAPREGYWDEYLSRLDRHLVMTPSAHAHRGPEVGGLVRTADGLLVAIAPESDEERWDVAFVLLDGTDPRRVLGRTGSVLTARTAPEITGPICVNCVFPGTPVLLDPDDPARDVTPDREPGALVLVPHGQGDTHGALAVGALADIRRALLA